MDHRMIAANCQDSVISPDQLKIRVQKWWNERPCGSTVSREEVGSRAFFDEVERHRYTQEPHIPALVNFPRWQGKEVLEIGCGMGTDLLQFARAGAHVTGVDLTPRAVEITTQRFAIYDLTGQFQTADAEALPFADGSFDLVYSHGVLHHTPNTQAAIDQVYRVLKPGGTAMVMLYHKHSYNYLVNIRIMRALAFAMLRRGMSEDKLSRWTGVDLELLRQYAQAVRERPGWTLQDLVNNNTDGPGNPLSKVYSRRTARRLFGRFKSVKTHVHWLVKKNIPIIGKHLPDVIDHAAGRLLGWDLHIVATK
jgi:ubiquinone/menaquinone biosynthesis C-methylase UbiE